MQFFKSKNLYRHFTIEDRWIGNKHIKRCSTSLVITDMQIKTTNEITLHTLIWLKLKRLIISSVDKGLKELEPPYTADWK